LGISTPVRADDFSMILQDRLLMHRDHLTDFLDFSSDLADRVNNILPDAYTFKEWAAALKSKAYTRTRINRALLHVILNIREEDLEAYRDEDYCMYARILGFREAASPLLTKINRSTALPMIGKMSGAKKLLSDKAMRLLQTDIDAADIFRNVVYQKFGTTLMDEYKHGIIKQ
ncbi:MAG: nucleotidyltransferase family protein, partial [Lachnospiraceae bacterium]|nr:nucleotidyltransferase family protein [Lachnospiraceae bacterium]